MARDIRLHRDILGGLLLVLIHFSVAILVLALLSSCATTANQTASPNSIYKYDMLGSINGTQFDGSGVIPRSNSYKVTIQSRVDVDLLAITTCHRDFTAESAISPGWFQSKRGYQYLYEPVPLLEAGPGPCILRFGAYNKSSSAQNAWGMVDFEDPGYVLPGMSYCNGIQVPHHGVAVCQSRAGLIQMITFPYAAVIAAKDLPAQCVPTSTDGGFTWRYQTQERECLVVFMEKASPNRFARLTHFGYNAVPVRGN